MVAHTTHKHTHIRTRKHEYTYIHTQTLAHAHTHAGACARCSKRLTGASRPSGSCALSEAGGENDAGDWSCALVCVFVCVCVRLFVCVCVCEGSLFKLQCAAPVNKSRHSVVFSTCVIIYRVSQHRIYTPYIW